MPYFHKTFVAFLLTCGPLTAGTQTTVPKEDPEVVLHNPDMGWVIYENYPLDARSNGSGTMSTLPDEVFQGCDHVAVMFAWSDVEITEGNCDWTRVDEACAYWTKRGKSLHLRMSTEPLFGWSRLKPPGGLGIPEWLLNRIPDSEKVRKTDKDGNFGWHVDARNPIYQDRLRAFLKQTQVRFSGERSPGLIDLRGFGRWGEWHSGYPYGSLEDKREALKTVLDIWTEAFPENMLALSYSFDPDGPLELHAGSKRVLDPAFTGNHQEYLRFSAFDLALEKPNIALRRDGAGGAVSSNERKLSQHLYRELRRAPQASEFVGGYRQTRPGGPNYLKWVVDDALSLHPNYINLMGYGSRDALDFMNERPDLVAHGLRGMGYRLVPLEATLPKAISAGKKFILKIEWTNRAAGRALRDYTLKVRLTGNNGRPILAETEAATLSTSQWLQGDKHITRTEISFPKLTADGPAKLDIALYDPSTKRVIHLPLASSTRGGFCRIAEVLITP